MRRTVPFAIALVATIVVVLGVMVGVGIGLTTGIHGGSPSDVFMRVERTPEVCAPIGVNTDGVDFMDLEVDVKATSHLLVYFSFEWSGLDSGELGQVNPRLDAADSAVDINRFTGYGSGSTVTDSLMTVFPDVLKGTHTVDVYAAVADVRGRPRGSLFASLGSCVLTVFVIPAG